MDRLPRTGRQSLPVPFTECSVGNNRNWTAWIPVHSNSRRRGKEGSPCTTVGLILWSSVVFSLPFPLFASRKASPILQSSLVIPLPFPSSSFSPVQPQLLLSFTACHGCLHHSSLPYMSETWIASLDFPGGQLIISLHPFSESWHIVLSLHLGQGCWTGLGLCSSLCQTNWV